jgi:uncharacterized membrane protein YhfC
MLYVIHALNFILMILLPILLGLLLARRLGTKWGLYVIGAITFVASQIIHIPLNNGLTALFAQKILPAPPDVWKLPFNAVVLGLTAGLCEEIARYLVYRYWIKSARTWRAALMFGAGHGGIEAIILGGLAGVAFINFVALRNVDVATLPVPVNQQVLAAKQIAAYWSLPWYTSLLGAVERAFTLCFHLSAAVMVLQVFRRRNILWLGAAILWHAALDAAAVFAVGTWGPYWTEAIVGAFAVASLIVIFALRPIGAETPPEVASALPSVAPARLPISDPEADLRRKMDETRFT